MSVPDVWGGLVVGSYLTTAVQAWHGNRRNETRRLQEAAGSLGAMAFVFFAVWMFGRIGIAFVTGT